MDNDITRDIKNFIKQEGGSTVKRLQSLRIRNDLSLGGTKFPKRETAVGGLIVPKKQFVPNLNQARNKDRANEFLKKYEQKQQTSKKEHKFQNNRKKDNNPRLVQSTGIFSEGIVGDIRKSNRWSDSRDKENDATATIPVPTIKKNSWMIDKHEEDKVLDEIMEDHEDIPDQKLPFQPFTWHLTNLKTDSFKFDFDAVKAEPGLSGIPFNPQLQEYFSSSSFSDNNPSLSLWELPHSLAGKGLSDDPNCKEQFDYNLNDMVEGQIGKVIFRKSGKVEVFIGNIKYNLDPVLSAKYTEQMVALDIGENDGLGKAAVLGQIQNRYKLTPDWFALLK